MPKRGGRIRNWKPNEHFGEISFIIASNSPSFSSELLLSVYVNSKGHLRVTRYQKFLVISISFFHIEHDDRAHSNNTRRVSFKSGSYKGKSKFRSWNDASQLLLDGDIDMGASGGYPIRKGFRNQRGRLSSPAPRTAKRKFIPGPLPWYQIVIPYGAKHDKDVILRSLLGFISPEVFIPHYYKINGNTAVFYVDDVKIAEKLYEADRKIVMSDGFKLLILVRNSVPNVNIDADMKEKMKLVMAKRYNAATKALDLTKFHADPGKYNFNTVTLYKISVKLY